MEVVIGYGLWLLIEMIVKNQEKIAFKRFMGSKTGIK